jgi:hypothetical protein
MSCLLFQESKNYQFLIGDSLLSHKEKFISFFSSSQRVKYNNSLSILQIYHTFFVAFFAQYKIRKTNVLLLDIILFEFGMYSYK